jgi:hypothetical protein
MDLPPHHPRHPRDAWRWRGQALILVKGQQFRAIITRRICMVS